MTYEEAELSFKEFLRAKRLLDSLRTPCPKCGSRNTVYLLQSIDGLEYRRCEDCGHVFPVGPRR